MIRTDLSDLAGEWDQVLVQYCEDELVVAFPYHKQGLTKVKRIEGATWQAHDKSWSLPLNEGNALQVRDLVENLRELFRREQAKVEIQAEHCIEIAAEVCERLQADFDHSSLSWGYDGGEVSLGLPYCPEIIKQLKKIEGKRWDSGDKLWYFPADQEKKLRSVLRSVSRWL